MFHTLASYEILYCNAPLMEGEATLSNMRLERVCFIANIQVNALSLPVCKA